MPAPLPPLVLPRFHAASHTWSYIVADAATGIAAIVDPALDFDAASARVGHAGAQGLLDDIAGRGWTLAWILETHAHADHLSAAQWLKRAWPGARTAIGAGIVDVQRRFAPVYGFGDDVALDGSQFDRLFADGERFAIGTLEAEVIATPGHTGDGVAYRVGDALFIGDTLFMPDAGSARCDFPGGDASRLYRSIRRLYALPDATRVFVCHDYSPGGREPRAETTIGAQKRDNIHLRDATTEAEFVALRQARDATLAVPQLLHPSLQVNLRAGALPEPDAEGRRFLVLPLREAP